MVASLPNPFLSALEPSRVAETAAGPRLPDPEVPAADNFRRYSEPDYGRLADEPLPLFLTKPAPEMELQLIELLRACVH